MSDEDIIEGFHKPNSKGKNFSRPFVRQGEINLEKYKPFNADDLPEGVLDTLFDAELDVDPVVLDDLTAALARGEIPRGMTQEQIIELSKK